MKRQSNDAYQYAMFCEMGSDDAKNVSEKKDAEAKKYQDNKHYLEQKGWLYYASNENLFEETDTHGYFGVCYYKNVNPGGQIILFLLIGEPVLTKSVI